MKRSPRLLGMVAGLLCVALAAASVWAQESRRDDQILHRYLDPGRWADGQDTRIRRGASEDGAASSPRASAEGEGPGLWVTPGEDEWIWTADGPVGPGLMREPHGPLGGQGETELDAETDFVDALEYQASFDPSVVPFKRGVAQNRITRHQGGRYTTRLEPGAYERVFVGGQLAQGEERFWGSYLVRMDPRMRHSVPSVAPDQRILSIETEPPVNLVIERDEAGNFYLIGPHQGLVRINLEIGVRRAYFDGSFRRDLSWDAFGRGADYLDSETLDVAAPVLEMIGVERNRHSPVEALERLVEHYRDFQRQALPELEDGSDRYVEISSQQLGVCRHRSLTFMISAQSLGIETRYVYNEAHAFAEVYWPEQGWRRIDLGGAADTFNYSNQGSGRVHDGLRDDDLPRPQAYEDEMAEMDEPPGVDDGVQNGEAVTDGGDGGEGGEFEEQVDETRAEEAAEAALAESAPGRRIELLEADGQVFRGQSLSVRGRVHDGEPGTEVEIFLVPSGAAQLDRGLRLGTATVDEQGFFQGEWSIPSQVDLGRWELRAR